MSWPISLKRLVQRIMIDTVNPKELMSSASKYFASRTSPRSEASSIDQDLLDSARSTRSISSGLVRGTMGVSISQISVQANCKKLRKHVSTTGAKMSRE